MNYGTKYEGNSYTISTNLYEPSTWDIPDDFKQGFFSNQNPLWAGEDAPYGHLLIPETHIGGHRIGLIIRNATGGSVLSVYKIPLTTEDGDNDLDAPTSKSKPVSSWIPSLLTNMQQESSNFRETTPISMSASCPFKRYAFYSSNRSFFKPIIPSPLRARHHFPEHHRPTLLAPSHGTRHQHGRVWEIQNAQRLLFLPESSRTNGRGSAKTLLAAMARLVPVQDSPRNSWQDYTHKLRVHPCI